MNRVETILYTVVLWMCCATISVLGIQCGGKLGGIVSIGAGSALYIDGMRYLLAKHRHLLYDTKTRLHSRYKFGAIAVAGILVTGAAIVVAIHLL